MACFELDASKITKLRKFRDLRIELKWSVNEALGFLSSLWGSVVELNETGEISDWDAEYLCELTHVEVDEVDSKKVWDALVKNQWIIQEDGERFLIADYIDMAGTYLIRRYHNSDRQKLINIWAIHGRIYGRSGGDGGVKIGDKGDSSGEKYSGSKEEVNRISEQTNEEKLLKCSEILENSERVSPNLLSPPSQRKTTTKTYPPTPQNGSSPPNERIPTLSERRNTEKRPEVKVLIDHFYLRLKVKFGEHPSGINYGQAGKEFYTLLGNFSMKEIDRRMDFYFRSEDPFIVKNGYSFAIFFSKFRLLKDGPIPDSKLVGSNVKRFIDGLSTAGADKEFPGG